MTETVTANCRRCGTELAPQLLACPACGTLAYANTLTKLADEARAAEAEEELGAAAAKWREALTLLPLGAPQAEIITGRVTELDRRIAGGAPAKAEGTNGRRGVVAAIGTAVVFALSKAKLLVLGFTKIGTLFSMLAFLGVYWGLYGWKFALGLVLSIYIHEMGHVSALRHYGIPASAPMFIPGIGAFVRLNAHPATAAQDARVGLAGPIWGFGAALVAWGLYLLTQNGLFASIAHVGAVINLFNLIPVWQLDGARGLRALARAERWVLLAIVAVAFLWSSEGMLLLVGLVLAYQCFQPAPKERDMGALAQFVFLVVGLTLLAAVRHDGVGL